MKLKIISHSGNYPVDVGGPQSVAYHLALGLAARKTEVELGLRFASRSAETLWRTTPEAAELERKGVAVTPFYANYSLSSMVKFPVYVKRASRAASDKPDLVHYNSPPVDANIRLPGKYFRKNVAQTIAIHGGLLYEGRNLVGRMVLRRQAHMFSGVVALNGFSKTLAVRAGFNQEKIRVVPNGVDTRLVDAVAPAKLEGDPSIVYAGRFEKVKGIHTLLDAVASLRTELPGLRAYFIGDGSLKNEVARAQTRLAPNVVLVGKLPSAAQVLGAVKGAQFFVLPSLKENFSLALLEAMACRTPIVVSDAEGNVDALSPEEAWFFKAGSAQSLCQTLGMAHGDPGRSSSRAEKAFLKARSTYSWDNVCQSYYELFSSLAAGANI